MTYPPEQVLLGGGVEDFRYLQVGVHAEAMLWGSGRGGAGRGAIRFMSLRSGLHMRVLRQLQTEEETQIWFSFVKMTETLRQRGVLEPAKITTINELSKTSLHKAYKWQKS